MASPQLGLVVVWFLMLLGLGQVRMPETPSQTQSVRPEQGPHTQWLKLISERTEACWVFWEMKAVWR